MKLQRPGFRKALNELRDIARLPSGTECEIVDKLFESPRLIWLSRRNKVRQAVSLVMAERSGIWRRISGQEEEYDSEPVYRYVDVKSRLEYLAVDDHEWSAFFREWDEPYLQIEYEDLERDYFGTLKKTLKFLGIEQDVDMQEPRIIKQANQTYEQWVLWFCEHSALENSNAVDSVSTH